MLNKYNVITSLRNFANFIDRTNTLDDENIIIIYVFEWKILIIIYLRQFNAEIVY